MKDEAQNDKFLFKIRSVIPFCHVLFPSCLFPSWHCLFLELFQAAISFSYTQIPHILGSLFHEKSKFSRCFSSYQLSHWINIYWFISELKSKIIHGLKNMETKGAKLDWNEDFYLFCMGEKRENPTQKSSCFESSFDFPFSCVPSLIFFLEEKIDCAEKLLPSCSSHFFLSFPLPLSLLAIHPSGNMQQYITYSLAHLNESFLHPFKRRQEMNVCSILPFHRESIKNFLPSCSYLSIHLVLPFFIFLVSS